jgi:hypothetical protein
MLLPVLMQNETHTYRSMRQLRQLFSLFISKLEIKIYRIITLPFILYMYEWRSLAVTNVDIKIDNVSDQGSPSFFFFNFVGWGEMHSVRRPLIGLLYQPRMIHEYGEFCGMRIDRGNRSTRRKPAPVPLCPSQIPHDPTWDRTRAATVGSRRLIAWAMTRPFWTRSLKLY